MKAPACLFTALFCLALTNPAFAHWPTALNQVLPISVDPDLQEDYPAALPLDSSRTLICWRKELTGNLFQIVDRYGNFSFAPPRLLQPAVIGAFAEGPEISPDGQGGVLAAIPSWVWSGPPTGVYAQRIDPQGTILWGDSAVRALPWPDNNFHPALCSDGQGGAYVAVSRDAANYSDLNLQHLTPEGQRAWGDSGIAAIVYDRGQFYPQLQADGQGGCYLVWKDSRPPYYDNYSVFAQRFNAQGHALWSPASGLFLGQYVLDFRTAVDDQHHLWVLKNGGSGSNGVLYRVSPQGAVLWSRTGLCTNQEAYVIPGEPGFMYLGWKSGYPDFQLKAQRVDLSGRTYWPSPGSTQGIILYQMAGNSPSCDQYFFSQGEFFAFFKTASAGSSSFPQFVRAQKLNSAGQRLWGEDGVILICYDDVFSYLHVQRMVGALDGVGGLVGVWENFVYASNQMDIVAKHVNADSSLGGPFPLGVTLTPHNPPIQIPPSGGNFSFDLAVAETDSVGGRFDLWVEAVLPGGDTLEIAHRQHIPLAPQDTLARLNLVQMVPAAAPPGTYSYRLYAGNWAYHNSWGQDEFTFVKLADSGQARMTIRETGSFLQGLQPASGIGLGNSWVLKVDPFPGESTPPQGDGFQPQAVGHQTEALITHNSSLITSLSPNPFNPTTSISYELPAASLVSLKVYDTAGRLVTTLVNGRQPAGKHEAVFEGSELPSGVYLYQLKAGENTACGKMVLLK